MTSAAMTVSGLYLYPVKSLRGLAVPSIQVDELGFVGDRRFLVVTPEGLFLTQRTLPKMALIGTALSKDHLTLSIAGATSIAVPLRADSSDVRLLTVSVWKSEGLQAEDCGDDVASWLTQVLETPVRLVRIGPAFRRPVIKATARPGDLTMFSDAYPFMTISEASLSDLNRRLVANGTAALPMNRFRPNIVIAGAQRYAEDTWSHVRMGEILFRAGGPCARCIVTTINQDTASGGKEPLRTLAAYRRDANDSTRINFGQNLIHETKRGILKVGDSVTPQP